MAKQLRVIISGGGTGGHIFPAIAIANAIKAKHSDTEFLFVGAEGRMEIDKVPAAGYEIMQLPVIAPTRKTIKNFSFFKNLIKSIKEASKIISRFRPNIAIGVGGYVSFPILWAASKSNIPVLIQEQNSFAGMANRWISRGNQWIFKNDITICVAYDNMEKYFPKDKIVKTGNPVRQDLAGTEEKRQEGYVYFQLDPGKKTILVIGGSLGSRTFIDSIYSHADKIGDSGVQFILQTGKQEKPQGYLPGNVIQTDFISRMDLAYSVADLVISRAGAGSISELCLLGKPTILVPWPKAKQQHQKKNVEALVQKDAAIFIPDEEAVEKLIPEALKIIQNDVRLNNLKTNILQLALPNAANEIVTEVDRITNNEDTDNKLDEIPENIYFLGVGGIGMSNLARYFISQGKKVAGYDKTSSILTEQLEHEGAQLHYKDEWMLIPENFRNKTNTLIIFTPAIPFDNSEFEFFQTNGFVIMKRAQVLGKITGAKKGICIAGTHGKTTTSSMIAHILKQSHVDCNAFLGGILKNYNTNLLLSKRSDLTVIEADEYDRSFHWLNPYMAVITAVTPDHLDIYGTEEEYRKAFIHFTSLIKEGGVLLMEDNVGIEPQLNKHVHLYRYAGYVTENADFYAKDTRFDDGKIVFDFVTPDKVIQNISLGVPFQINIANGVAALAIAYLTGLSDEELRQGMATFLGVKRRFDSYIEQENRVLIDDYAHHPEELEASISSVRKRYPNRKLTVVFQPHLYSRTKDFYHKFAQSLSKADEVILLPIYPARELAANYPGVSSEMIIDLITAPRKKIVAYNDLVDSIEKNDVDVLLMAGAGDIELLVEPIKEILLSQN